MACNDMRAQHLLDACARCSLAVPEEIAVLGVDNDELLCEQCEPPLSSIEDQMPVDEGIGQALPDAAIR
jgi:LacI family transcriptional regulator